MSQFIQYGNASLHYHIVGNGLRPLLVFHGFGQNKEAFHDITEALSKNHTLYIFDLFFHGKSEWNDGEKPLEKDFWKEILDTFLSKHKIESFSILGFSMGGKFAFATLEKFTSQVKEIFLLAPDGIKISPWYTLATYPYITRKLFKSMILHPQRFLVISSLVGRLGLLDKTALRFVDSQMNTVEKRKQVYYSWIVFRHLKFNMSKIAARINSYNIPTTVIAGRFDKIVPSSNMKGLLAKLNKSKFEILETGHNGLIRKWTELIQSNVISDTKSDG